jgi:hypothetical protein
VRVPVFDVHEVIVQTAQEFRDQQQLAEPGDGGWGSRLELARPLDGDVPDRVRQARAGPLEKFRQFGALQFPDQRVHVQRGRDPFEAYQGHGLEREESLRPLFGKMRCPLAQKKKPKKKKKKKPAPKKKVKQKQKPK